MEKSKVEHKKQVLIVDDDPDFADALAEVFQSLGYDVITANSFQDGLRVAREQKPMVAFVDVQLGTERGTGMVPLLLKDNPDMLCLVMTAYTDADTVIEALKAGAYDYLRKPIDLYDVQRTLERSFDVLQLREDNSQAVKNLRDSEQRYRSLVEGIPQGMLIHSNGRPLFVNPEFVRIFGYGSMKEVLELKKLDMLFENPLEVMSLATKTAQLQDSGPGKDESEDMVSAYKGMRKDGSEVWFERFPQPILWEGQAAELVSFLDVSERIKLEEQLRHSQKLDAVGYLASGVAHDFNNLLQIIRGYAELGLKRSGGDEKLVDVMNKVMDAAEKGGSLTRQLLAFSRKEVMKLKSLNLHELTANLVKMLKRIIGEDIELSLIFPDDLPRLQADPGMIEQVLLNLCVNARDAMPDGGRLVIEAEKVVVDQDYRKVNPWAREKHYVQLSVTDTGTGMSPEVLEKVFEPFFTTKKLGRGTGLGLSVAYGIIKQHRGFISVYSEEGLGTTFRIYLPAEFNPREQQEENA
ncbi:MAG: ATP-binding protein, partial [Deltaproteobacteria bacterium]|nr:ATP-binding protein [Deltaproteobacteria bacterium]